MEILSIKIYFILQLKCFNERWVTVLSAAMPANEIKKNPIKMLAQAENDGHISKGTVLVTLNPFTRQQRGLWFENWITVEMQFNPWLTHWVF